MRIYQPCTLKHHFLERCSDLCFKVHWYRNIFVDIFFAFRIKLWKKSLSSDGQQFHQYQQNEQSHATSNHWKWKRPRRMKLEIEIVAWNRHTNVEVLNRLMWWIPTQSQVEFTDNQFVWNMQLHINVLSNILSNVLSICWLQYKTIYYV